MDVCPEEEAASVHLHGGAFKAGDDLYTFLLVCEQIKNASASGLSHVLSLPCPDTPIPLRPQVSAQRSPEKAFSLTSPVYKMVLPPLLFPSYPILVFFLALSPLGMVCIDLGRLSLESASGKQQVCHFCSLLNRSTPGNYVWNRVGPQKFLFEKCSLYDFIKSLSYLFSVKS